MDFTKLGSLTDNTASPFADNSVQMAVRNVSTLLAFTLYELVLNQYYPRAEIGSAVLVSVFFSSSFFFSDSIVFAGRRDSALLSRNDGLSSVPSSSTNTEYKELSVSGVAIYQRAITKHDCLMDLSHIGLFGGAAERPHQRELLAFAVRLVHGI